MSERLDRLDEEFMREQYEREERELRELAERAGICESCGRSRAAWHCRCGGAC